MNTTEKTELILLLMLTVSGGLLARWVPAWLPEQLSLGRLLLGGAALLLLQSLVRDLWLLAQAKRKTQQQQERAEKTPQAAQCMCLESIIGITSVLAGAIVLGAGNEQTIFLPAWGWSLFILAVTGTGFLLKDFVLGWNPWRIYQEKDHLNTVITWRKS